MLQNRTKPVNIRVTESEFKSLREACQRIGARNVSELARDAMKYIMDTNLPTAVEGQDIATCLNELEERLASLQAEVARMKAVLNVKE